jgi:hypothetical protein
MWRHSRRLKRRGFDGEGVGQRSMALARGSGSSGGPARSSWRWWLDQVLTVVGQRRGGAHNRGSRRRRLLRFLAPGLASGLVNAQRRRKDIFLSLRAAVGDKGVGTGAHGCGGVNHGLGRTVGGGGEAAQWSGWWACAGSSWGGLGPLRVGSGTVQLGQA